MQMKLFSRWEMWKASRTEKAAICDELLIGNGEALITSQWLRMRFISSNV